LVLVAISPLVCCNGSYDDATRPAAQKSSAHNQANATAVEDSRKLVESQESLYNNIYVYRTGNNISMTFGVNQKIYTESTYNTVDERDLPVPYTPFMTSSLIYPKKIDSILEIGSGGGRISWYLHRFLPKAQVTTVELDPTVVALAYKYFGIREEPNFHVVTRDGRIFLAGSKAKYDIILIDTYRGPFVPFHLLTKEFYQIVREHLADGGVMALNLEPTTMLFDSAVNTLHEVFPQLEFYDAKGNIVVIAYDGTPHSVSDLEQMASEREFAYSLRYDLREMLTHRFGLKAFNRLGGKTVFDVVDRFGRSTRGIDENAKVLTDDFAPVESLKAIAKHNLERTNQSKDAFPR